MNQIGVHRNQWWEIACSNGMQWEGRETIRGWQDKSPDLRLGHVVGRIESFVHWGRAIYWRLRRKVQRIQHIERHRSSFYGCRRP
jgi:hypothetical protein